MRRGFVHPSAHAVPETAPLRLYGRRRAYLASIAAVMINALRDTQLVYPADRKLLTGSSTVAAIFGPPGRGAVCRSVTALTVVSVPFAKASDTFLWLAPTGSAFGIVISFPSVWFLRWYFRSRKSCGGVTRPCAC
jgi:hypothetical protein